MCLRKSLSVGAITFLSAPLSGCQEIPPPITPREAGEEFSNDEPLDARVENRIWRVEGDKIVTGDGEEVLLRGISFENQAYQSTEIPSGHHTGRDFTRVREMGMNTVRFHLSSKTFEDDASPFRYKTSGWDWVDQNVEWAKENGIRLVLNMHTPGANEGVNGWRICEDEEAKDRFVALWQAIAERYRAEPTVAGFEILNKPCPTRSLLKWAELAQNTVAGIRKVNQKHMVFVGNVNTASGDSRDGVVRRFVRMSDPNVVYTFRFNHPYHFTHQNDPLSEFAAGEGWYPDPETLEVGRLHLKAEVVKQSDCLPPGDSEWMLLETDPFDVYEGNLVLGKPFLVCDSAQGKATFDDLSLTRLRGGEIQLPSTKGPQDGPLHLPNELEDGERKLETLFSRDLDTRRGWLFWSENGDGEGAFSLAGHGDHTALSISGTTGPAHFSSDPLRFRVEPGSRYQLHVLARGEGLGADSSCRLRLEFYSSDVTVRSRGRESLREELSSYLAWGDKEGVPLYLGEFGTIRDSFLPGRGGVAWVADMLDLLDEARVSFAYRSYHDPLFGLFAGQGVLPNNGTLNRPLHDLFVEKLNGSGGLEPQQSPAVSGRREQVEPGSAPRASSITEFD